MSLLCAYTANLKCSTSTKGFSSPVRPYRGDKRKDITISMDERGRAYDNIFVERLWRSVKHDNVYLYGYATDQLFET